MMNGEASASAFSCPVMAQSIMGSDWKVTLRTHLNDTVFGPYRTDMLDRDSGTCRETHQC